jgi:VWFA-related protein
MRPFSWIVNRIVCVIGLVAVGLTAPVSQAQVAGPPQAPQRPVFRSDVNFIMVDAYPLVDGRVVEGLTAADFEVREDGRPQRIESFEYVRADERLTEGTRREPGNQRQMLEELADPRARAFVVYLDTHHLGMSGTYAGAFYSREPIVELFHRILAPGDLIALATSRNHPRQMTFGRRSDVVEQQLTDWWTLQDPDVTVNDAEELTITTCFPFEKGVTTEMVARRRQDQLLSSLEGTVEYLGEVREGRKTLFLFSHGWSWFAPNQDLLAPLNDPQRVPPTGPPIVREPWQQMRVGTALWEGSRTACELELIRLANLDSLPRFQQLLRDAALNNVVIYPVNPGGTGAIGGGNDRLMELASNTGGTAVVNRNDLVQGMIDVSREFEGYYLLGYASDNQKADGSLRRIQVRVNRPGVTVKARQGYRALSSAEAADKAAALAAPATVDAGRAALDAALDVLATIRPGDEGAFNLSRYLKADAAPYLGVPTVSRATPSPRSPIVPVTAPAFRRSERLHIEWPVTRGFDSASARVLGRDGNALAVQVAISERTEGDARVLVGDVVLGPLASGDFVVELTVVSGDTSLRTLVAFRVVP